MVQTDPIPHFTLLISTLMILLTLTPFPPNHTNYVISTDSSFLLYPNYHLTHGNYLSNHSLLLYNLHSTPPLVSPTLVIRLQTTNCFATYYTLVLQRLSLPFLLLMPTLFFPHQSFPPSSPCQRICQRQLLGTSDPILITQLGSPTGLRPRSWPHVFSLSPPFQQRPTFHIPIYQQSMYICISQYGRHFTYIGTHHLC
jgi:hypothetical protein